MTTEELLEYFHGNQSEIARRLGVVKMTVCHWIRDKKIPIVRQYQIQVITLGSLRADRE